MSSLCASLLLLLLGILNANISLSKRIVANIFRDSYNGVPVDYSYNETSRARHQIASAPGCPASVHGYPWVLYGGAAAAPHQKCYLVGQEALVCRLPFERMHLVHGSIYGRCACDFKLCLEIARTTGSTNPRYAYCEPSTTQCMRLVYDKVERRCYNLYHQGPCGKGKWLVEDEKGGLKCSPRSCGKKAGMRIRNGKKECCEMEWVLSMGHPLPGECLPEEGASLQCTIQGVCDHFQERGFHRRIKMIIEQ